MAITFKRSYECDAFFHARSARLVRFNGTWLTYEPGGYYREISDEVIRSEVRQACAEFRLKTTNVNNAIDEIKSATVVDGHGIGMPFWLIDGTPSAANLIVCRNGILDPITRTIYRHDDRLITLNALPYDCDPNAAPPIVWIRFLNDAFGGDAEAIGEFQKLVGYLIGGGTWLQKLFAIIGPKRSGKGTIGRVLVGLLGSHNVASPSFNGLSTDFGLQGLIGKLLAIIPDARLGPRTDRILVAERLLNISGEDALSIPRKYVEDWHGKLASRLLILSNELPALPDPSGALASRYVVFHTPNSFYGREDHGLTDAILRELPGVLNWALDGIRRLNEERIIRTPASARELLSEIDALSSPVKAFAMEKCTFGPSLSVTKENLWNAYRGWHISTGINGAALSQEHFSRNLKTAFAGIVRDYRPRADGARPTAWLGLTLTIYPDQSTPAIYGNCAVPFGQPPVSPRSE